MIAECYLLCVQLDFSTGDFLQASLIERFPLIISSLSHSLRDTAPSSCLVFSTRTDFSLHIVMVYMYRLWHCHRRTRELIAALYITFLITVCFLFRQQE